MFHITLGEKKLQDNPRIHNSIRNIKFSILNQFITLILGFGVRTIFIRTLGIDYLGINGLFSNILVLLSLTDLGMTASISYSLYKPLLVRDESRIRVLMNFFANIYILVGIATLVLGISLMPFLKYIIKDAAFVKNINLIYLLFVVNAAASYLFMHKQTIIVADQKNYIVTRIGYVFNIVLSFIQISALLISHNYLFYLCSNILIKVFQSFYISNRCNKLYPFLQQKTNETLCRKDIRKLYKNITGLFLYKLGEVIANGTNNIIISVFLGINWIGLYSNYVLVSNAVNGILYYMFNAVTASIGNLVAENNNKKSYHIFRVMNFMNFWFYGICSICIWILIDPFIKIWLGEDFIIGQNFSAVIAASFYVTGMLNTPTSFRSAYGLFWNGKFMPMMTAAINLIATILLVSEIGISGIFIGTIISFLLTQAWYDPYILHRVAFNSSMKLYVFRYMLYIIILAVSGIICYYSTIFIVANTFFLFFLKALVIFIIANILFSLFLNKTEEFIYVYKIFTNSIKMRL